MTSSLDIITDSMLELSRPGFHNPGEIQRLRQTVINLLDQLFLTLDQVTDKRQIILELFSIRNKYLYHKGMNIRWYKDYLDTKLDNFLY